MTTLYILIAISLYFAPVSVIAKFCAKSRWEQRFILAKDRRERLAYWEKQIADAEDMIVEINDIPGKEECEKGDLK